MAADGCESAARAALRGRHRPRRSARARPSRRPPDPRPRPRAGRLRRRQRRAQPPAAARAAAATSSDCAGSIGLMAPITGGAASIGGEQLNFANARAGRPSTSTRAPATSWSRATPSSTRARRAPWRSSSPPTRTSSRSSVRPGSQEVEAVGPTFAAADLAFISPSATRTSLTGGDFPTFFRVIPTDAVQGPTDAEHMVGELGAEKVVIVEEKTSYGQGLADAVSASLSEQGVEAVRIPVNQDQPDYSAVVSRVADDTDVVFVTFQIAANTKVLANQLQQQGKDAVVFASDGSFSADFDVPGAYVSSFAPDIRGVESAADVVEAYTAEHDDEFGTFGPPVYVSHPGGAAGGAARVRGGRRWRGRAVRRAGAGARTPRSPTACSATRSPSRPRATSRARSSTSSSSARTARPSWSSSAGPDDTVDFLGQQLVNGLTLGRRVRPDRAGLHPRLRRPAAAQLRPRRRLHGRCVPRLLRHDLARRSRRPVVPVAVMIAAMFAVAMLGISPVPLRSTLRFATATAKGSKSQAQISPAPSLRGGDRQHTGARPQIGDGPVRLPCAIRATRPPATAGRSMWWRDRPCQKPFPEGSR